MTNAGGQPRATDRRHGKNGMTLIAPGRPGWTQIGDGFATRAEETSLGDKGVTPSEKTERGDKHDLQAVWSSSNDSIGTKSTIIMFPDDGFNSAVTEPAN